MPSPTLSVSTRWGTRRRRPRARCLARRRRPIAERPPSPTPAPRHPPPPPPPRPSTSPPSTRPATPASPSEQLTAHPAVVAAINRIVAAAGQMAATVQVPFLSLCDASMGYHLPSCLRLLEAAHVPELLRAGPLHVREIAARTGVEQAKLAHILRLLATHHLLREAAPDVFAVNRISSLIDTGKPIHELLANPERKYDETSGVAAFVGLCCDELYKSSAYLTEAVFPGVARLYAGAEDAPIANASASSPSFSTPTVALSPNPAPNATVNANAGQSTPNATASASQGSDPTRAPFNYAFGCGGVGYFAWLEGEGWEAGAGAGVHGAKAGERVDKAQEAGGKAKTDGKTGGEGTQNPNRFRLERFGKAMAGTGSWEAPGAVLHGFDWGALPRGSVVVDVGGGIGSTSMLLASAYAEVDAEGCGGLRFVIQDRPVVVEMGEKAWRAKCPELLDSGAVRFQVHDFFAPQPVTDAAVFLLRVVLHDWPDAFAQRILLRLREAATPRTRLVLADFVLPLACVDDFGVGGETEGEGEEDTVAGAEKMLAPAPLLANLGKASANAYWMDLTVRSRQFLRKARLTSVDDQMQATFNGRERTLRETVALALSAGWKVVRVTKAPGSLFGHIVAVPAVVPVPPQRRARAGSGSAFFEVGAGARGDGGEREMEMVERASSRCGTPTFGSRVDLPSVAEARARFGGSVGVGRRPFASGSRAPPAAPLLRQAAVLTVPPVRKKKPSPLSVVPPPASPSPSLYRPLTSPRPPHTSPRPALPQLQSSPTTRRMSQAPLFRSQSQSQAPIPRPPAPPSPMSPRHPLSRRSSYAHLSQPGHQALTPPPVPPHQPAQTLRHVPSSPVLKQHQHQYHHQQPSPPSPVPSRIPALARRASHTQLQLPQMELRKRSGSIIHPAMARAGGGSAMGMGMGSLLLNGRVSGGALDFGRRRRRDDADGDSESADDEIASARASPTLLSARSVLAAAARIERGIPRSPSPDP
ncbi:O-methyltransferase [Mycena vulgaris]|nr:O-methyltransferase [Mycena vulgaris]